VFAVAGKKVLGGDPDADFHRRVERPVDRCLKRDHLPRLTGWRKFSSSTEAVTHTRFVWREAAMAAAMSIMCIRRPPRRLPRRLVSFGSTISVISTWEERTLLGASDAPSVLSLRLLTLSPRFLVHFLQKLLRVPAKHTLRIAAQKTLELRFAFAVAQSVEQDFPFPQQSRFRVRRVVVAFEDLVEREPGSP